MHLLGVYSALANQNDHNTDTVINNGITIESIIFMAKLSTIENGKIQEWF